MKTCPKMQQIIEALAAKHGLDLAAAEGHLRLELPCFMPLVIEKIGRHLVSVTHYYYQNGDACPDPDMVFYTGAEGWMPVEITQVLGYTRCLTLGADGKPEGIAIRSYNDVASFAEFWANNIREQGWLERGQPPNGDQPTPTPDPPPAPAGDGAPPPSVESEAAPLQAELEAVARAAGFQQCIVPDCPCGGQWITDYRAAKYECVPAGDGEPSDTYFAPPRW